MSSEAGLRELIKSESRLREVIEFLSGSCSREAVGEFCSLAASFEQIVTDLGGKFLYICDGESDCAFLACLIDFNKGFCRKRSDVVAGHIFSSVTRQTIDKIRTIGNDTFWIKSCLVSGKERKSFFEKCMGILGNVYPECHFVLCSCERRPSLCEGGGLEHFLDGSYIYHYRPQIDMMGVSLPFEGENRLWLALPEGISCKGFFGEAHLNRKSVWLENYSAQEGGSLVFEKEEFGGCMADAYEITYEQLLSYQKYVNIFSCKEHMVMRPSEEDGVSTLFVYTSEGKLSQGDIYNDRLREMVASRGKEWELVGDVILMYPVVAEDKSKITDALSQYETIINSYMHYLDVRLQCETGVPYGHDGADMMDRFKKRIKRYYLEAVRCRITEEMIMDILDKEDVAVGADIFTQLMVAIDEESGVGVLYVISLSSPFLLSHLLDNGVRNQIMVVKEQGTICNLYEYVKEKWEITLSGTPKSYVTIPSEKNVIDEQQLAALLMSETIYEEGEEFSRLVDPKVVGLAGEAHGMGQYDIAYVGVTSNTFIQFYPSYRGSIQFRLFWNSVTAFYIELILFEEAAITRFNKKLVELMSDANKVDAEVFLKKNRDVTNEYLNTVEFWDVQLNYPSSQHSIRMIKEAFQEQKLLDRMERYQSQVRNIFEINKELVDRHAEKVEKESNDTMNAILFILTIVSTVSAIYQIVDYIVGYVENAPLNNLYPLVVNIIILVVIAVVFLVRKRKKSRRN